MTGNEIRQKFLNFFENKAHVIVPSSSLLPDDPSVLLTTAGMQQFKPYYTGDADPVSADHPSLNRPIGAVNVASSQKCFRTSDIDEVGDSSHLTFFEMLGNFSFGGYFKEEAINLANDFITKELGLEISYVTVFAGHNPIGVPRDDESIAIWKKLGIKDIREEGMDEVFWGPTGTNGPCGPTTEIYAKSSEGEDIEVWNIVFNEFFFSGSREELLSGDSDKELEPLTSPGVDTGMGLERLVMIAQKKPTIFDTDLFIEPFENVFKNLDKKSARIIADHVRGAVFLFSDGIMPSNKEAGYVLRRLIRRAARQAMRSEATVNFEDLIDRVAHYYGDAYPELKEQQDRIKEELTREVKKFEKTVEKGIRLLNKFVLETSDSGTKPSDIDLAKLSFDLYQSYGLPIDVFLDEATSLGINVDPGKLRKEFDNIFEEHQKISRAGQEKKFGGHGLILDTGELKAGSEEELKKVLRLHTSTHLLQQALREVLGPEVKQMGSDITASRTRFDFSFPRKLTEEEVANVEDLINKKIKEDLPVGYVEMPKDEAKETGALYFFKEKYPDTVKVYFVGKDLDSAWSKEFCGGPHVEHTGEIGSFKIAKQESVGAGVRRVRGVVE